MAVQQDVAVRAVARVNLAAIERNAARMRRALGAGAAGPAGAAPAALCAVVKADGYGHGAVPSARAALAGGATLAGRRGGPRGDRAARRRRSTAPILVMGALAPSELDVALAADADVVAWEEAFVAAVAARGGGAVHVKLDTGMGRLGTRDPAPRRASPRRQRRPTACAWPAR